MKRARDGTGGTNDGTTGTSSIDLDKKGKGPGVHTSYTKNSDKAAGRFVWRKKLEQERKRGVVTTAETEAKRIEQLGIELEEAKRQRAIRDAERLQRDAEQRAKQRDHEAGLYDEKDEERFVGRQHYNRQAIRLRNGRGKLVDVVARVVRLDLPWVTCDEREVMRSIMRIGNGDKEDEEEEEEEKIVEEFLNDVKEELEFLPDFPQELDSDQYNTRVRTGFWNAVRTVVEGNWKQAGRRGRGRGGGGKRRRRNDDEGVHEDVLSDVDDLIKGKDTDRLLQMEREIAAKLQARMANGGDGEGNNNGGDDDEVDEFGQVDFWTVALDRIRSCLAVDTLKRYVHDLCDERRAVEHARRKRESNNKMDEEYNSNNDGGDDIRTGSNHHRYHADRSRSSHRHGRSNEDDRRTVDELERDMVRAEAARGMEENETAFTHEVVHHISNANRRSNGGGSSRRRKPLYFNRVHTGYNWSKYNRTHYDHDNPPPKTVQGYKFNIFYPDLDDRSRTPTYTVSKTENPDVAIITFKAGPPYEDIAFKIVNRPWERSHRRGFRSSFDRGVLQLWFHFQHLRYRR